MTDPSPAPRRPGYAQRVWEDAGRDVIGRPSSTPPRPVPDGDQAGRLVELLAGTVLFVVGMAVDGAVAVIVAVAAVLWQVVADPSVRWRAPLEAVRAAGGLVVAAVGWLLDVAAGRR